MFARCEALESSSMVPIAYERVDPWRVRIPRMGEMRTDGLVFADEKLFAAIGKDDALRQVANVAHLPGIVGPSMAMPDIHWGYGFPIGGVAAFDAEEGVVSPGAGGRRRAPSARETTSSRSGGSRRSSIGERRRGSGSLRDTSPS